MAAVEAVDRKTAAAAYRRLQNEGLVRVEPRSGIFLEGAEGEAGDPLRRLHLAWLERTLASAKELGLDARAVQRMFQGASAVEGRRIPVVDPDPAHAALLARELSVRTGLECVGTAPHRLPAQVGPLRDPPFVVATPGGGEELRGLRTRLPVVVITLAAELFEEVCAAAREAPVLVVVGTRTLKAELEQALERGLAAHADRVEVARPREPADLPRNAAPGRVLVWPGSPSWVAEAINQDAPQPSRLVARSTVKEIRCQVARAALDHVSRSTASATRK